MKGRGHAIDAVRSLIGLVEEMHGEQDSLRVAAMTAKQETKEALDALSRSESLQGVLRESLASERKNIERREQERVELLRERGELLHEKIVLMRKVVVLEQAEERRKERAQARAKSVSRARSK